MPFKITCPTCRMSLTVPETLAGKKIRCKKCEETLVVPQAKKPAAGEVGRETVEDRLQDKPRPYVPRTRPRPVEEEDQPRQRPRRKTRERQSSHGLVIALVGGGLGVLLIVVLTVVGALWFWKTSKTPGPTSNSFAQAMPNGPAVPLAGVPAQPPGGGNDPIAGPPQPQGVPAPIPGGGNDPIAGPGTLRYRWQGGPHIYLVRVEGETNDHLEIREGNCIVEARPADRVRLPAGAEERKGSGTGFVVNPNGFLLTCAHVVAGARQVEVVLGGRSYPATVLALNHDQDLALIQIAARNLPALSLANSDAAQVGQEVRALGFPLSTVLGESLKATRGTLSGKDTKNGVSVLQIDASINPGNSGGPLVTEAGEVLGVTSAKLAGEAISNVGFSTPSNEAKKLLASKGVAFTTQGGLPKLDGPTLVSRVSPSVALVRVTLGASVDTDTFQLTCRGHLGKRQQPKEGMAFMPLPPVFDFPDPFASTASQIKVDASGQITQASGGIQMPFLLGELGVFLIEPLPEDNRSTWETTNPCSITQGRDNSRRSPFGRFGPMGPRFGPPFGPAGPRFGPPFGPMGPRFGPPGQAEEEPPRTRVGTEHCVYRRGPIAGDLVRIYKKYEMKVPAAGGDSPSLNMTGDSDIAFNVRAGLPRTIDFKATLVISKGNTSHRLPITVSYRLLEGAERDRFLNQPPPTPPATKPNSPEQGPPQDWLTAGRPAEVRQEPPSPKTIPGLIGYWAFEEKEGSRVADGSGNKADGVMHGGRRIPGIKGQALWFNGNSDYFDYGPSPRFNFGAKAPFTFAGWVRTRDQGPIVSQRHNADGGPDIIVEVDFGGNLAALVREDRGEWGEQAKVNGKGVRDGQWHHFALTRNAGNRIELFLDGVSQGKGTGANAGGSITTDLRALGSERYWLAHGGGKSNWAGVVDEFCIFDRELTAKEIEKLAGK